MNRRALFKLLMTPFGRAPRVSAAQIANARFYSKALSWEELSGVWSPQDHARLIGEC